jgi:hypothetical protein
MNSSYLPESDADRVVWLTNFGNRIGQYASALGLTTAEVTNVQHDATMFAYVVQQNDAAHQYAAGLTNLKKLLKSSPQQMPSPAFPSVPNSGTPPTPVNSGIFNRLVLLVARIKQNSAYSAAMGQDLNIIPPVSTVNLNDMSPNLTVKLDAGHPLLKWTKGQADGTQLYVDRRDNNGFVPLAKVFRNNYLDVAPLPANVVSVTWDYKAKYLIGDDEVGLFSPVVSIEVIRTT